MRKLRKTTAPAALMLAAALMLLAGCGGGGGGSASSLTPAGRSGALNVSLSLPREALQSGVSFSAEITVGTVSAAGVFSSVATATTPLTYTTTSTGYSLSGTFSVTDIPAGNNYLVKVAIQETYTSAVRVAGREAGVAYTYAYVGGLADITEGVWNSATISPSSSAAALAAIRFATNRATPIALADVTAAEETAINTAVSNLTATDITDFYMQNLQTTTDPFSPANWSSTVTAEMDALLSSAGLIDVTAPQVLSFVPASGATGVAADGTVFKVVFNEGMDTTVDLNTQTTLTASGFALTITRSDTGGSLTINANNALNYGTFSWGTTTTANDTLIFTMKSKATLTANSLKTLAEGKVYAISAITVPSNLKDDSGNALVTTGIPTGGSFTTADTTPPSVVSFSPVDGATAVPYDGTVFSVVFSETMDASVDMNNTTVLTASGFSITLQSPSTGGSLTINATNALNYGMFSWMTTTVANDTLAFTLNPTSTLEANSLKYLQQGTLYNITARTVPTNLKDAMGNALSTTGIPTTGSFTTDMCCQITP